MTFYVSLNKGGLAFPATLKMKGASPYVMICDKGFPSWVSPDITILLWTQLTNVWNMYLKNTIIVCSLCRLAKWIQKAAKVHASLRILYQMF